MNNYNTLFDNSYVQVDSEIYDKVNQAYSLNYMCLRARAQQIAYKKLKNKNNDHNTTNPMQSKSWFVGKKQQLAVERNYYFKSNNPIMEEQKFIFADQLRNKKDSLQMILNYFFNEENFLEKYVSGFNIVDKRLEDIIYDNSQENEQLDLATKRTIILSYDTYEKSLKEFMKFEALYDIYKQLEADITEQGEKSQSYGKLNSNVTLTHDNDMSLLKCVVDKHVNDLRKSLKINNKNQSEISDELDYLNFITGSSDSENLSFLTRLIYAFNDFHFYGSNMHPVYAPVYKDHSSRIETLKNNKAQVQSEIGRLDNQVYVISEIKQIIDNLILRYKYASMDKTSFNDKIKSLFTGIPTRKNIIALSIKDLYIHKNEIELLKQAYSSIDFDQFRQLFNVIEKNFGYKKSILDVNELEGWSRGL